MTALRPAAVYCRGFYGLARQLLENPRGMESAGLYFGFRRGSVWQCTRYYSVRNISGVPCRFEMDPWGVVVAHKSSERYGLELVAVFHTHPRGAPVPSVLDRRSMRLWPVPWIIASPRGIRAWMLDGREAVEVALSF